MRVALDVVRKAAEITKVVGLDGALLSTTPTFLTQKIFQPDRTSESQC